MPEKKNSQTGNFLSWLFKKHFLKLEIIFTPTIDKEPIKDDNRLLVPIVIFLIAISFYWIIKVYRLATNMIASAAIGVAVSAPI